MIWAKGCLFPHIVALGDLQREYVIVMLCTFRWMCVIFTAAKVQKNGRKG